MTDEDNLRDRVVAKAALRARLGHVIDEALREKRRRYCECTTHEHVAQAIIDDLHLEAYDFTRHDGHTTTHVHGWMEKQ